MMGRGEDKAANKLQISLNLLFHFAYRWLMVTPPSPFSSMIQIQILLRANLLTPLNKTSMFGNPALFPRRDLEEVLLVTLG